MNAFETFKTERNELDSATHEVGHVGLEMVHQIREGRFERSLALIAGLSSAMSGLEVAYEHYRGSYSNRIMYTPVILSQTLLAARVYGAVSRRGARTVLPIVSALTLADCLIGFGFHIRAAYSANREDGESRFLT